MAGSCPCRRKTERYICRVPAVLIELHYFPSIAWFSLVAQGDQIQLEQCEHFQKQTYRNRCRVLGANRVESLVVPLTGKHGKVRITEVLVDYKQRWRENHWRTIESAYRKSPYFEHYAEALHQVLFSKEPTLFELNMRILEACLHWLRLPVPLKRTVQYETHPVPGVLDCRNMVDVKYTSRLEGQFKSIPYQQVFGNNFFENLSIIDLIFCAGPDALELIRGSMPAGV